MSLRRRLAAMQAAALSVRYVPKCLAASEQLVERSYSCWIQLAATAVCVAVGVLWLLAS